MPNIYNSKNCGTSREYIFRPIKRRTFAFQVRGEHDVCLCLTPTASETPHQQYEIFLGGWGGGQSAIRRNKKDDVCKVQTTNILSKNDFRGFWITLNPHAIQVGKEGEHTPFLIHKDPSVKMNVAYYGYCTAYGVTGQWIFEDDEYGQGLDMGSVGKAIDGIACAPTVGFQPMPGAYPPPPPYYPPTVSGNIKWVQCNSLSMCPSPVELNPGPNQSYVAIAYHNGSLTPGSLTPPQTSLCHISWGCQVHAKMDFFLLSNPTSVELVWQSAASGTIPVGAIQGGYSENGELLYIGRFRQSGTRFQRMNYVGGKVHPSHKVCYAPFQGNEVRSQTYEVLCFKTVPLALLGI